MKKIIVTQRLSYNNKTKEKRDSIDIKLIELLLKSNIYPIPIPNSLNSLDHKHLIKFLKTINPNGLLLTGGENFGVNKSRDNLRKKLVRY